MTDENPPSVLPDGPLSRGIHLRLRLTSRIAHSLRFLGVPAVVDAIALSMFFGFWLLAFGRAHIHSIWMDPDVSGWTAPLANRLAGGHRLYEDGLHTSTPPLSFVLLYGVTLGKARWLTESVAIILFQGLTVALLYRSLSRVLPRPVPLLAALATTLVFEACPKLLFSDNLAQFWVAAAAALLCEIGSPRQARNGSPRRLLIGAGMAVAACLLSLQTTGAGLLLGGAVVVLAFPRQRTGRQRLRDLAVYGAAFATSLVLLLLLLSPLVSLTGFVRDVLFSDIACKGGVSYLRKALSAQINGFVSIGMKGFVLFIGLMAMAQWQIRPRAPEAPLARSAPVADAIIAASCLLGTVASLGILVAGEIWMQSAQMDMALAIAMAVLLFHWVCPSSSPLGQAGEVCLILLVVCVCAAAGQGVSVPVFRWAFDNNPLVAVVFAVLAMMVARMLPLDPMGARSAVAYGLLSFVLGLFGSSALVERWQLARSATVPWPEIPFVAGARFRPEASGVRWLVAKVRSITAPADTVLLLPDDPEMEAWIDRPRPAISSAKVFAYEYADSRVDDDFERLRDSPPSVVIVGPREHWRAFGAAWRQGSGAERLVDRVVNELLPEGYVRLPEVPIAYRRSLDAMDIYVREERHTSAQ